MSETSHRETSHPETSHPETLWDRLPHDVREHIHSYDPTPKQNHALVLIHLELVFKKRGRRRGYKRVLHGLRKETWLWYTPTQAERYAVLWRRPKKGARLARLCDVAGLVY